jgi:uncharacterized protein YeaO (DUF488 family)
MIKLKRAYAAADRDDGARFLAGHLRPREVKKEDLKAAARLKSVSPSNGSRNWFKHDPAKWAEFQRRYFAGLDKKPDEWQPLPQAAPKGDVTLVFGERDTEHNNAVALNVDLTRQSKSKGAAKREKRPEKRRSQ